MATTSDLIIEERPGDQVSRGALRKQVTSRILAAVFQGRFPSGRRLVVQRLAEMYGVSPTPVREALVEVAGLGIVELIPNRGAIVLPFGAEQVREIYQVRRVLEVEAARGACHFADREILLAIRNELERLNRMPHDDEWDRGVRAADTWLHSSIPRYCGSPRLAAELARYHTLCAALRDVARARDAWTNFSRVNDVPEHLLIIRALLDKDEEAAAAAMDSHLRNSSAVVYLLFTNPGPAAAQAAG